MAKLLITTQVYENYGSLHQPHWKAKGGSDYVIKNFTQFNSVRDVVEQVRGDIEADHPYYSEHIISWSVVEDDYLTEFERNQLEFDGKITYPAQELDIAQGVA